MEKVEGEAEKPVDAEETVAAKAFPLKKEKSSLDPKKTRFCSAMGDRFDAAVFGVHMAEEETGVETLAATPRVHTKPIAAIMMQWQTDPSVTPLDAEPPKSKDN
mmetsp:Transcript_1217/g.2335  ORF Transcript_1217/g.2335 Transcript_1217/m.2335 type:complete len:104 (-) Transcript_1217:37-348(-)